MSIRPAERRLTGSKNRVVVILTGVDDAEAPVVSLHPSPRTASGGVNFSDPEKLRALIADLSEALQHLEAP